MTPGILACGPFFHPGGMVASLFVFLILKPLGYYAFIQAFRFRVNRPVPMTVRQAAQLAAIRAVLGFLLVAPAGAILYYLDSQTLWQFSWVYLYAERLIVWWCLGAYGAKLSGRRLIGWTISGTLLNAGFDAAIAGGLIDPLLGVPILAVIAIFIAALHVVGRRDSLQGRFAKAPFCKKCEYNLTGNLSGICPECGTPVAQSIQLATA